MDIEVIAQHVIQLHQNTCALGRWDVGDGYVTGEGIALGAEAPVVVVVVVLDVFNGFHAGADVVEFDATGGAFQQDVEGFADNVDAGPEDESSDDEGENRVDPGLAGEEDGRASGDNRGGRKGISCHVNEGASQVDVARHAPEEGGNHAVHQDAGGGNPHHELGLNGHGSAE